MHQVPIVALNVKGGKRGAWSFAAGLKYAVFAQRISVEMVFDMNVSRRATHSQYEVQRAVGLDVVAGNSAAVLQLLARIDQALLVGGDALLVLDFGLHSVDGVEGLDLEFDGLAS